jgi:hypothetical protein
MRSLSVCVLAGVVLIFVAAWVGWIEGRSRSAPATRFVSWWLGRVVLPQLTVEGWARRAAVIGGNNLAILAMLMGLGQHLLLVLVGTAVTGVAMGIAVRVLPALPDAGVPSPGAPDHNLISDWRIRVGIALNLLEPPAIAFALGLAIAQSVTALSAGQAWALFLIWVVPAMLLAAGGEALWLGALLGPERDVSEDDRETQASGKPEDDHPGGDSNGD